MTSWSPSSPVRDRKMDEGGGSKWQITPPIVTGERVAAVRPGGAPSGSPPQRGRDAVLQGPVTPGTERSYQDGYQQSPDQESTPLFRVSFRGPDQQWYRFSANRVEQGNSGALELRTPHVARPAATTPQPALHPTWNALLAPGGALNHLASHPASPLMPPTRKTKNHDFVLQIVQPALTGLMDGSVSTLAPIFAIAFATRVPFTVFLVGMASALGAGISMAFAEALSDDGELTGRGKPILRGLVTGLMTFLSGAGHTLPFLIPSVQLALNVTYVVVVVELLAIAAIRSKFFGTSWWLSMVQVVGGGILVVATSVLLGSA